MEFDLNGEHKRNAYKLLAGLVTPRPIAWVTTQNENGIVNAAPFSFFNVFGTRPPMLGFAPGDKDPGIPKDTARNIRRTREFVVNLVDEASAEVMNQSSRELDHEVSETELLKLETTPSSSISPPRLTQAPVALECREWSTLEVGENRLVIGLIDRIHTRKGVIDPETLLVDPDAFSPIGRMEVPSGYCRTEDRFQM
ncbi:MAG: flavin reductase family protein, partial [Verrucomicrobiota bacterium]